MGVVNEMFTVNTEGFTDIIDITRKVQSAVYKHNLESAVVYVYAAGSTVGITNIEFEPGLLVDLPEALDKIAPVDSTYHHDETWHDGNGNAHILASIVGSSVTIPVVDGILFLGTWQQIVLIDFDNKHRSRNICVQICM